jgi:hypothetical protein
MAAKSFRPRFSLRTLLVAVTVACFVTGWLVYQFRWIRDRQAAVEFGRVNTTNAAAINAPWQIRILGERGYRDILISDSTPERCSEQEAHTLFPEARIYSADKTGWIPR